MRPRRFLHDNGLSIAVFSLFLLFLGGQAVTGHFAENQERIDDGRPTRGFGEYLSSGVFLSATMENWESEFLQMAAYVIFTVFLFQRGSSESKKPDEPEPVDRDPRHGRTRPDAPWPVRRGGLALAVYQHSLSITFLGLFLATWALHAWGSLRAMHEEQLSRGMPPVGAWEYLTQARFWFESFQNWQSEFLSLGSMAVLSIYLRQRGSPESKPVDAPHHATGG